MNETTAAKLAGILGASYPGRTISKANLSAWVAEFKQMDEATGTEVAGKLKHRSAEPPSVAQVRQCLNEVHQTTFSPPVLTDRPSKSISFGEWIQGFATEEEKETARRVFPSWFKASDREANVSAGDVLRRDLA